MTGVEEFFSWKKTREDIAIGGSVNIEGRGLCPECKEKILASDKAVNRLAWRGVATLLLSLLIVFVVRSL